MDKVYCIFERVFHPKCDGFIPTYHVNGAPIVIFKDKIMAEMVCKTWNILCNDTIILPPSENLNYFVVEIPVL